MLGDRRVHRAEDDPEVRVLLLEALVEGLLAPHADDAREVLALRLRDAELLEGVLLLLGNVVPAVVAAGLGRGVEDELGQVEIAQVDAPGRDRLALEDLERLERFSRIQSGSPLILESSAMTSRLTPFLATSWPWSFSLIVLGLLIRVLSVAAMWFGYPFSEVGYGI